MQKDQKIAEQTCLVNNQIVTNLALPQALRSTSREAWRSAVYSLASSHTSLLLSLVFFQYIHIISLSCRSIFAITLKAVTNQLDKEPLVQLATTKAILTIIRAADSFGQTLRHQTKSEDGQELYYTCQDLFDNTYQKENSPLSKTSSKISEPKQVVAKKQDNAKCKLMTSSLILNGTYIFLANLPSIDCHSLVTCFFSSKKYTITIKYFHTSFYQKLALRPKLQSVSDLATYIAIILKRQSDLNLLKCNNRLRTYG